MAGQSQSSLPQEISRRIPLRLIGRVPSTRTILIIFVALLILFSWLHFILALQIASTGRQIQIQTEELQKIERENTAILQDIAEAESPRRLAERARSLGYEPQQPIYLPIRGASAGADAATGSQAPGPAAEAATPTALDRLGRAMSTWAQADRTP